MNNYSPEAGFPEPLRDKFSLMSRVWVFHQDGNVFGETKYVKLILKMILKDLEVELLIKLTLKEN